MKIKVSTDSTSKKKRPILSNSILFLAFSDVLIYDWGFALKLFILLNNILLKLSFGSEYISKFL